MARPKRVQGPALVFVCKVALKGSKSTWRRIAMRGDQTLNELHEAIYDAFDRYDEHLYSFYFLAPGARGQRRLEGAIEYAHPMVNEDSGPFGDDEIGNAAETRIDSLGLTKGQKFEYLFDYGDNWWHELTVEEVTGDDDGGKYPRVLESHGKSPDQYPDMDDDE